MKKIFLILLVVLITSAVKAQICLEISADKYAVLSGQEINFSVKVSNIPPKSKLTVSANGSPLKVENNVATHKVISTSPGEYNLYFETRVKMGDSTIYFNKRELNYIVFAPMSIISNVNGDYMIQSLWNEIGVIVPGVHPKDIVVSCTNGQMRIKGTGKYEVKPNLGVKELTMNTAAKVSGRVVSMGNKKFIVREIPEPTVNFYISTDSTHKHKRIWGFSAIMPLGVSRFSWVVESWKLSLYSQEKWTYFEGTGKTFDLSALAALGKLKNGDKILLENVVLSLGTGNEKVTTTGKTGLTWIE